MQPVPRLLVAGGSALVSGAAIWYASKRWSLTDGRHKEMTAVGSVAVAVIVWLLLADAQAPVQETTEQPAPQSSGTSQPVTYQVLAPNLIVNLSNPMSNSSCACQECDQGGSQLTDLFAGFARDYYSHVNADQQAIYQAELLAIPSFAAQYMFANPLVIHQAGQAATLFTGMVAGDDPIMHFA